MTRRDFVRLFSVNQHLIFWNLHVSKVMAGSVFSAQARSRGQFSSSLENVHGGPWKRI